MVTCASDGEIVGKMCLMIICKVESVPNETVQLNSEAKCRNMSWLLLTVHNKIQESNKFRKELAWVQTELRGKIKSVKISELEGLENKTLSYQIKM